MATFLAEIRVERPRKNENKKKKKKIFYMSSYLTRNKKFQKLKNTIIASFQIKIGWEWPRKREKKKIRSDEFLPNLE